MRWLSFMPFQAKQMNQASGALRGPPRKKQRVMANFSKGFKKEFDPQPSDVTLSEWPPSWKLKLFKSMIAPSWLKKHPEFKNLQPGGEWLIGFANRLERDELHDTDRDYLKELTVWHDEKEREMLWGTQPVAGPSPRTS